MPGKQLRIVVEYVEAPLPAGRSKTVWPISTSFPDARAAVRKYASWSISTSFRDARAVVRKYASWSSTLRRRSCFSYSGHGPQLPSSFNEIFGSEGRVPSAKQENQITGADVSVAVEIPGAASLAGRPFAGPGAALFVLLGSWGEPYGAGDLIELLGNWGPCPK